MQAQVAPAVAADDQRGAQLVAEPDRAHDVAVARAFAPPAAGGSVQRPHVPRGAHQLGERVDVAPAQLVVEEQRGHRDERVLAVGAGEEQGLRVGGREERRVDRHHPAQRREHLPLQLRDVQAAVAQGHHRAFGARGVHGFSVDGPARRGNPNLLGWPPRPGGPTLPTMTTDQLTRNKHLVESFIQELFTKGDLTAVDRYVAPDFVNHDPPFPGAPEGAEGMRQAGQMMRAAVPDWRSEADHYIAEGDLVVEHFHASGTRTGELFGAPPDGKVLRLRGIHIFRIANDKIVERWGCLDFMAFNELLADS